MSKLYVNSKIFCPCGPGTIDFQQVITDADLRSHNINDLSFCPSCQIPKCQYCYRSVMVKKYCSSCTVDYTRTNEIHCGKNCFTCPHCTSMLAVSVKDEIAEGVPGKKFDFECGFCKYKYSTDVITKPKPILSIIKGEYSRDNSLLDYFDATKSMFKHQLNYSYLHEQLIEDLSAGKKYKGVPLEVVHKLKQLNLSVPLDENFNQIDKIALLLESNTPDALDEDEDLLNVTNTYNQHNPTEPERNNPKENNPMGLTMFRADINNSINPKWVRQYPIPKPLTSQSCLRCCDCNHELLVPTDDLLSTKFSIKWNANDYLPLLTMSPLINQGFPNTFVSGTLYTFLIHIINPLPFLVSLNVSIPSVLQIDDVSIHNTIPVSSVRIGGYNPKDHIIRGIPTAYLTRDTKVSRAELIMRVGKINSNKDNDTSIDLLESLIEKSDNWYLLPIEIVLNSLAVKSIDSLKIPVFVTLNSKIPESMKQLGLSKKELSFGFWTVIDLGKVSISC